MNQKQLFLARLNKGSFKLSEVVCFLYFLFRQKFPAESMGTIKLKLYTITKNFEKYGVET